VLDVCFRLGVEHVTVYAFSIENFNRSKEEVDTLFELLRDKLDGISRNEDSYTLQNKVRVKIIGNKTLIPLDILKDLETIEARTSTSESKRALNVCFPYTSRDEITHAIRQIAQRTVNGGIDPKDIGVKDLHDALYLGPDTPPLDLLIRTSGHTRLSDFMLWQCNSNCTIEFVNTLWPDFRFLSITLLLFKWMYYRALQLGDQARETTGQTHPVRRDTRAILSDSPSPPIAVSVAEKAKPVHSGD
jgi:ditrans,polycis-polyprenyl diphosphate synthase